MLSHHLKEAVRIVVVIPMYGKEDYTRKCVSLLKENYGTGKPIEILVVDDGSETPFVDPTINVIRLDENSGFTRAANEGILWAQYRNADAVLLLNNDTEPHPGFLKELVDAMESDENLGIVGSIRFHPTKPDQPYELVGSDLIRGFQYFVDEKGLETAPKILDCNWFPLCSGLLRMDMIREIGLLDKRFRNHCSDSSYCLWAKINGWKVAVVPSSVVTHHLSVTTTSNKVDVEKDQKMFLEKIAGIDYAKIMAHMPLDGESKTWGKIDFMVYTK